MRQKKLKYINLIPAGLHINQPCAAYRPFMEVKEKIQPILIDASIKLCPIPRENYHSIEEEANSKLNHPTIKELDL